MSATEVAGVEVVVATPCGRRGGPSRGSVDRGRAGRWYESVRRRVDRHSRTSAILVWRCAWCRARHSRLTEEQIATLNRLVKERC